MAEWRRAILHVDMDAFYASVEQLDRPEWRGRPVVVCGAAEKRGVVSAASYEARVYGVRSAMPTARALRLCPGGVFTPPRMDRYEEVSRGIFAVFHRFTPLVQPVSLDEAFLDVSGSQRLHGDPPAMAAKIREIIRRESGLTASVGVASRRFAAKIASDLDKPDGLTVIGEGEIASRLAPLPIGKLWGVGAVTERRLAKFGILTIGQLAAWPPETLRSELGRLGEELGRLANGLDDSPVLADEEDKSISREHTFASDVLDRGELENAILERSDQVAERLRERSLAGRVVFLKVRYGDFTTLTRRKTLPDPVFLAESIQTEAVRLLRERSEAGRRSVRLIGVGVTGLTPAAYAHGRGDLFARPEAEEKLARLAEATDRIHAKLGREAIQRASIKFKR